MRLSVLPRAPSSKRRPERPGRSVAATSQPPALHTLNIEMDKAAIPIVEADVTLLSGEGRWAALADQQNAPRALGA